MGKTRRMEIEDFVQNIEESLKEPDGWKKAGSLKKSENLAKAENLVEPENREESENWMKPESLTYLGKWFVWDGQEEETGKKEQEIWNALKSEWPQNESGERIYQITNIYEEKEENSLCVELETGIPFENGNPGGSLSLYLREEEEGWKLDGARMMEYLKCV